MKKIISVLLALVMVLGLSTTAFAANTTTVNIDDPVTVAVDKEYEGYQLLTLTTSLKENEHHPTTCEGTHSDDCYNYAYTINTKYRDILQKETFNNAGTTVWGTVGKPDASNKVTDENILKHLSIQSSDNGDVYGTLRLVADRIYRAIKTTGITADKTGMTGTQEEIVQGYWLIADVTPLNDSHEANSLVMLDTRGEAEITVTPKVAIPTVEKKVKDIEDSEDDKINDNPWHDSADHDIDGKPIPFKLTGTLPSNAQYYTSYKMVFHDTLSAGLTLNPESIKVYMYETKHKADVDTDLNDSMKEVTPHFERTTAGLTDGCTFEVSCVNVFAIEGVTKDTAFVVYYEATLNDSAVIGAAGNPNEVYLEYSNNPYGEGTGKTETDKVVVFTYQLTVNKTDSHGHALEGAGFTLSKKLLSGAYVTIGNELKGEDMTTFIWEGLDDGDYKLVETTVPEGYNKMADIVFSISATHDETADNPKLISLDGGLMGTGDIATCTITKTIENHTGTVLPETGAAGTMMLIMCSAMVVLVAAVFMITRKKMSIYED